MQFRCLLTVALAAGALGATACSGDDGDPLAVRTTSAGADDSTTTTEAPSTSTTLDFETEVKLAALALLEVRNEVFQQPDVARVAEYIADTCVCRDAELGFVMQFVTEGSRWTTRPFEPLAIRVDDPDPRGPAFTLIARQPAGSISGPNGTTDVPEVAIAPLYLTLARNAEGAWRINALDEIPLDPEAAAQIINEEGLP